MTMTTSAHSPRYQKLKKVGEGTFGVVYLGCPAAEAAEQAETEAGRRPAPPVVAIKKIRMADAEDGIHFTALREIKALQEIIHSNVMQLIDVYIHKSNLHIVYEFMDTDLDVLVRENRIPLQQTHILHIMHMLLQGVAACHRNYVMHRDIKPGNLLLSVDSTGSGDVRMALGDFGLARMFADAGIEAQKVRYTPQAVTRWYRAPELLFGADMYGSSVDIWSVGCVFAELMLRTPYFPGENDLDQLAKIFAALGTPTEEMWPGMKSLPNYVEFEDFPATPFKQLFTAASDDAIDLLSQMLVFDPCKRITAEEALKHPYFTSESAKLQLRQPASLPIPNSVLQRKKQTEQEILAAKTGQEQHDGQKRHSLKRERMPDADSAMDQDSGKPPHAVRRKLQET